MLTYPIQLEEDDVLDIQHRSRMDLMDAALSVIGRELHVSATARK